MKDETPNFFNAGRDPMDDANLLQLERELFSLTPVETPRCLASRLDRKVMPGAEAGGLPGPHAVARTTVAAGAGSGIIAVTHFRWRRIVVPAAAAVVAVSVLNRLESEARGGFSGSQAGTNPAPARVPGQRTGPGLSLGGATMSQASAARPATGYVLKTEPVYFTDETAGPSATSQYYIQRGQPPVIRLSVPRPPQQPQALPVGLTPTFH